MLRATACLQLAHAFPEVLPLDDPQRFRVTDGVHQLQIHIIRSSIAKFLFEALYGKLPVVQRVLVKMQFSHQNEALARVLRRQILADHLLRVNVMPGRVKIVDAMGHGIVEHQLDLAFDVLAVLPLWQPHTAEAQAGYRAVKNVVFHVFFPLYALLIASALSAYRCFLFTQYTTIRNSAQSTHVTGSVTQVPVKP